MPKVHHPISMVAAARIMNVPVMSVSRMRGVKKYGGQAAVDEVGTGKISLAAQYSKIVSGHGKHSAPRRPRKDARSQPAAEVLRLHNGPGPKYLTPAEVDPEFIGTPMEFTAKYGHVQIHTAEQYATMRFGDWAAFTRSLAKRARETPELKKVDHNWLRSPSPSDVAKLTEALECLRPLISEAEALLERAVAALKEKE